VRILPKQFNHKFFVENGVYYWFGETQKNSNLSTHGVNCYSTKDKSLTRWKFEGTVLKQSDIHGVKFGPPFIIDRPKVIKNPRTGKYVMYIHLNSAQVTDPYVAVSIADYATGLYTFVHAYQPDGQDSYDMTIFQDEDGSAYLICSVMNQFVGISLLSDDYLKTVELVSYIGESREGQALFKYKGNYYMWTSHLTDWDPNPAELFVADGPIEGASWTSLGNPSNDATTFDSQSAYVLPYEDDNNNIKLIYIGDRWNAKGLGGLVNATYVWLPIVASPDTSVPGGFSFKMKFLSKWAISSARVRFTKA
jgi:beta-galactosidase